MLAMSPLEVARFLINSLDVSPPLLRLVEFMHYVIIRVTKNQNISSNT